MLDAGMGLWTLLEGFLLIANALAILNEDRFLAPRGWSFSKVSGGDRAKSVKGQFIGLIYATQYLRVPMIVLNAITILVKKKVATQVTQLVTFHTPCSCASSRRTIHKSVTCCFLTLEPNIIRALMITKQ